jgi:uncharacterized membrane protein HdeD (DUF308 family)
MRRGCAHPIRTQALALAAGEAPVNDATVQETIAQEPEVLVLARVLRPFWWLWLVTGILWVVAALVILQFDTASVKTIGIIVGCMFAVFGAEQLAVAFVAERLRWLYALAGIVFLICAGVAFANPENTFAGIADILGFLFLTVGVWWIVNAFLEQHENPIWWLGLVCGIAMCVLAFWTAGQFFLQRAYALLAFAGIWALMKGITDMVRAFRLRRLGEV